MNIQNILRVQIRHLSFFLLLFLGSTSAQTPPPEPGLVQLTNSAGENAFHPNWSPKGDFISFIANRGSNNGRMNDVWEVSPDDNTLQRLTVMPDDGFESGTFDAAWIGQTGDLAVLDVNVFFEWLRLQLSLNPALPVVRTAFDGPSPNFEELLTIPGGLGGLSFAVSHDGQFAAWSEMITPSSSCPWVTNAVVAPVGALNGQATTSVGSLIATASVGCGGIPKSEAIVGISFSPDDSQIVIARASDPNVVGYDLEIYTTSGQFVRKLTNNGTGTMPVINWNPSWSSDGRIAFASNQTGRFEIYTINADGSNLMPVTTNGGDWPSWSPDSAKIAFQSTRSGNSEIYSIPAFKQIPATGTIQVVTNLDSASFLLGGTTSLTGSGRSALFSNVPAGTYTIGYGPSCFSGLPSNETKTLSPGQTLVFTGQYVPGFLSFPLDGFSPCTAPVSSVFDHSQTAPYTNNGTVSTYTGEKGTCDTAAAGQICRSKVNETSHYGFTSFDGLPFKVNGNYTGNSIAIDTSACLGVTSQGDENGQQLSCSLFLFYDGHPGFDYPAECFTPVRAAVSGTVHYPDLIDRFIDGSRFHVLEIIPDSQPGYRVYYLHLATYPTSNPVNECEAKAKFPENSHVNAGEIVGLVGKAGVASPHLHFEVHIVTESGDEIPVDPYGWKPTTMSDFYKRALNQNLWK